MLKKIITPILALALLSACNNSNETPTEETTEQLNEETEPQVGFFGEVIDESNAISISELQALLVLNDSVEVKVAAKINETCRKKGCWMTVDLGNEKEMLVRFKDYGFFVPKNADGFYAIMQGKAKRTVISVDELQHYAQDAGKTAEEIAAITQPEVKLAFEATGVIIKDAL